MRPAAREQRRNDLTLEEFEMLRLTEKIGLVGRRSVHEVDELGIELIVIEKQPAIFGKTRQLQGADASAQPSLHHQTFVGWQANAGIA